MADATVSQGARAPRNSASVRAERHDSAVNNSETLETPKVELPRMVNLRLKREALLNLFGAGNHGDPDDSPLSVTVALNALHHAAMGFAAVRGLLGEEDSEVAPLDAQNFGFAMQKQMEAAQDIVAALEGVEFSGATLGKESEAAE